MVISIVFAVVVIASRARLPYFTALSSKLVIAPLHAPGWQ